LKRTGVWLDDHPIMVTVLNGIFAVILLTPTFVVAALVASRRLRGAGIWGALGVAGFAFLMQVATGIARATEIGIPVRYLDVVALSGFAAAACAFALATHRPASRPLVIAWAIVVIPACVATMVGTMATVRQRRPQLWLENVRQYFPTHDPAIFRAMIVKDPEWPLPFISRDIDHLMAMLDDPAYQAIVPRSVTAPDELPHAVSRAASMIGRFGLLIVVAGVGGGTWLILRSRRRERTLVKLEQDHRPVCE
jgi:hypothetical protein